jgi:Mg-chelatase subunit ChlD
VAKWLGSIRKHFPRSAVQLMQRDAIERLDLQALLLEPELLSEVEPDIHLVGTLLSLAKMIPERAKEPARRIVRQVVEEVEKRLRAELETSIRGAVSRSERNRRPRPADIDWDRTIRANLSRWSPEHRVVIPEKLVGYARRADRSRLRDVILCVDQSGSMASSVIYAGIFGAVMASLRSVRTKMVVFDTSVVDLTDQLSDPVDLLFGTQLGGGTDIHRALTYCEGLVERPDRTVFVLITDLFEGGDRRGMMRRVASLVDSGVTLVCLLALNDEGAPAYDSRNAGALSQLGVPTFACTPELFPGLMATAIEKGDVHAWAARHDIAMIRGE